jgi:hypothetical protein
MTQPAAYEGTAVFNGRVSDFVQTLDPRNWATNAPEIWQQSYLIADPPPAVAPPGSVASVPLAPPGSDPTRALGTAAAWNPPGAGLFFEEVRFGGFTYRNVLATTYVDNSATADPNISFAYGQYLCLTTQSPTGVPEDGGIDVDNGIIECVRLNATQVRVTISKAVRFTGPADLVTEVNALAQVLVPLTLDIWLHSLMFPV